MKEKIKHYLKEFILFIFIMTIFANILSLYKSSDLNKQALPLSKVTLIDTSNYTIDPNKPILIHFWATWCPTCKLEAQNIEFISKHFNVITIAVNSGSNSDVKKYLLDKELTFKVINDEHSIYSSEFNIAAYPTTFIYDREKNLVFSDVGYTSSFGLYLRMLWASL